MTRSPHHPANPLQFPLSCSPADTLLPLFSFVSRPLFTITLLPSILLKLIDAIIFNRAFDVEFLSSLINVTSKILVLLGCYSQKLKMICGLVTVVSTFKQSLYNCKIFNMILLFANHLMQMVSLLNLMQRFLNKLRTINSLT